MKTANLKWFYLIALSLVWGSSFILMNLALKGLTPIQVGCFRILIATLVLITFGHKNVKSLSKNNWFWLGVNSLLGTFFPVFLFAYAINKMDSSIAAILNSLTPLNTLVIGVLIFGFAFNRKQILGIVIGLLGTVALIYFSNEIANDNKILYMSFILIASIGYAINVNIIKKHLQEVNAIAITTGSFLIIVIPTVLLLLITLHYQPIIFTLETKKSLIYVAVLAIFGTAIAKIFFNKLVQISSPIFSTSVTYLIPIVAVFWGYIFNESLNFKQLLSGIVILFGVYLVNRVR